MNILWPRIRQNITKSLKFGAFSSSQKLGPQIYAEKINKCTQNELFQAYKHCGHGYADSENNSPTSATKISFFKLPDPTAADTPTHKTTHTPRLRIRRNSPTSVEKMSFFKLPEATATDTPSHKTIHTLRGYTPKFTKLTKNGLFQAPRAYGHGYADSKQKSSQNRENKKRKKKIVHEQKQKRCLVNKENSPMGLHMSPMHTPKTVQTSTRGLGLFRQSSREVKAFLHSILEGFQQVWELFLTRITPKKIERWEKIPRFLHLVHFCQSEGFGFFLPITPRAALLVHTPLRNRQKRGSKGLAYRDFP